jgi:hypothetical protein
MTILTYVFAFALSIAGLVVAIKYLKRKTPNDLLYKASDYRERNTKLKVEIKKHKVMIER